MVKYITHTVGVVKLERRGQMWHARYQTPTGRVRRSLKVTNLRVAERKAREISDLLERGEYAVLELRESARTMTFSLFLAEFRAAYSNWGPTTWRGNESRLRLLLDEFGDLPLSGITT